MCVPEWTKTGARLFTIRMNSFLGGRIRRAIVWVVSVVLGVGAISVVQIASPAYACACGAPAPVAADPNGDVQIDQEFAIISTHGTSEQVDMRLSMKTLARDSGLIMPTPGPATVTLGDANVYETLALEMTPTNVTTRDWWTPSFDILGMSGAANPGNAQPPVVLDVVDLGPLEATVLAASDAQGLTDWLDANGYGLRDDVKDLLAKYIEKNWSFVALKLTSTDSLDGDLDPIRFVFDLPDTGLVYPLALSQAARTSQMVNVYIFDDHRRDVRFANGSRVDYSDPLWASPVNDQSLLTYGSYLTAYNLYFYNPGSQIVDDLVFPQSPTDEEYGTVVYNVVYMRILGVPLGWLGVIIVLAAAAIIIYQVRHRHVLRKLRSRTRPAFRRS